MTFFSALLKWPVTTGKKQINSASGRKENSCRNGRPVRKFTKGIITNGQTPEFAENFGNFLNHFKLMVSTKHMLPLTAEWHIRLLI